MVQVVFEISWTCTGRNVAFLYTGIQIDASQHLMEDVI
jgi:hypothetical protein